MGDKGNAYVLVELPEGEDQLGNLGKIVLLWILEKMGRDIFS
jgi:hypothetical protein